MGDKKQIKIKLSTAILVTIIIIGLIGAVIYFSVYYKGNEEGKESISKEKVEEVEETQDNYYKPSKEELARAKELESTLRDNLPKMDGSTSTIPLEGGIIAALFDVTQEEAESQVAHSTTYGSFDNLMEGKCDIIFSTPLSNEQFNTAKSKNIELELVPVVYEGFVFVVNASNPVNTLTQQQIKDIYSGKITNWKELGGNDAEIVAYQRNATSGSQNYMTAFMQGSELMEPKTDFIPGSMSGLMDAIATYDNAENAIGYSVYAYAADMYGNGNEIKFIKVDGVEPTKATMASKEYPLLNYNYAIYNKAKKDSTTVDELCEWLLNYNGQVAMTNAGYIPIINIKTEEEEINPYTKNGTGVVRPNDYKMDIARYETYSSILENNKIVGLKDQNLQNTINKFIEDSIFKLETKEKELDNYLKLLNKANTYEDRDWNLYENQGLVVKTECINGYLSVQIALQYIYAVQGGTPYIYDGYSAIFDLYTGEKLELSDLYFKDTEFISNLNETIKYFENHTPDMTPARTFKRTFVSIPEDIKMYSLTKIGFTKFNPYFSEGEIFYLDNDYNNSINKVIYMSRDMKDIWDSTIEIYKYPNSFEFAGEKIQKKIDNITYNIYTIDTGNSTVDSKINSYIENYINTDATVNQINEFYNNRWEAIEELDFNMIGYTYGDKIAYVTNEIGFGLTYSDMFFDLGTGELLDITYEQFEEQNGFQID